MGVKVYSPWVMVYLRLCILFIRLIIVYLMAVNVMTVQVNHVDEQVTNSVKENIPYEGKFCVKEVTGKLPVKEISELYGYATKSVYLSSGITEFFEYPEIREAFTKAAEKLSDPIQLILDSRVDWSERKGKLPWLTALVSSGKVIIKQSDEAIPHWIIVDADHIRLEKEHPPKPIQVSNAILYNTKDTEDKTIKRLISAVLDNFAAWWNYGSVVV
jgi:hypothetical protein